MTPRKTIQLAVSSNKGTPQIGSLHPDSSLAFPGYRARATKSATTPAPGKPAVVVFGAGGIGRDHELWHQAQGVASMESRRSRGLVAGKGWHSVFCGGDSTGKPCTLPNALVLGLMNRKAVGK